jgi:hypothetical protein
MKGKKPTAKMNVPVSFGTKMNITESIEVSTNLKMRMTLSMK